MQPRSEAEAERLARFGLTKDQLLADIGAFVTAWGNPARAAAQLGISPDALFNARGGTADVPLAVFQEFYVLGAAGHSSWGARALGGGLVTRTLVTAVAAPAPVAEPDTSAADARAFAAATGCIADRSDRLPAAVKAEGGSRIGFATAAEQMAAGGLAVETVRADLMAIKMHFMTWRDFTDACGVPGPALGNQARGNTHPTGRVLDAFYTEDDDGKLVLTARWQALRDTAPDDGAVAADKPLNGTPVPVVVAAAPAVAAGAPDDDRGTPAPAALARESTSPQRGEVAGVPLARAAAEAARFDPNIEDDGFVTVQSSASSDALAAAGSAVAESAGARPAATVSAEKGDGVELPAGDGPADSAGGDGPLNPPAQPVAGYAMRGDGPGPFTLKLTDLGAPEPLFANPSSHAASAGPNAALHAAAHGEVHWRWKMHAAIDAKLTALLVEQAMLQDKLDECDEKIEALRVLRALGDELPEPDDAAVAAFVAARSEVRVAA